MITAKKIQKSETIRYIIFGVFTTGLGIAVYQSLLNFGMNYRYANLISLIIGKLAAYIFNELYVFKTHQNTFVEWLKEFG